MKQMIDIKLPRTQDFTIAIDDRGITLEGRVDPEIGIKFWHIFVIYFMTGRQIVKYFKLDFPDSYFG